MFYRFKTGKFVEADTFEEAKLKYIALISSETENTKAWHKCTCLGFEHRRECPERSTEIPF